MSETDTTTGNELQCVLARLQGARTLLNRARARASHLQDHASDDTLAEIEALLQELYLETNAMAAEGGDRPEAVGDGPVRPEDDLDSLLGLANEDNPEGV